MTCMDFPAQEDARLANEAERAIAGFNVYELASGGWRAVHRIDRDMRIEHTDWVELNMLCVTARIGRELRDLYQAYRDEHVCGDRRITPVSGPGGGINV